MSWSARCQALSWSRRNRSKPSPVAKGHGHFALRSLGSLQRLSARGDTRQARALAVAVCSRYFAQQEGGQGDLADLCRGPRSVTTRAWKSRCITCWIGIYSIPYMESLGKDAEQPAGLCGPRPCREGGQGDLADLCLGPRSATTGAWKPRCITCRIGIHSIPYMESLGKEAEQPAGPCDPRPCRGRRSSKAYAA